MRSFHNLGIPVALALGCSQLADQGSHPPAGYWSRAVGFIDSGGIATSPLIVPDTVRSGTSFTVTVSTFGSTGCIRPDRSEVELAGATATITPYDSVWLNNPPCPPGWQGYARPVQLRFDTVGNGLIRLHGRGFDRDLTLERTITIRPSHHEDLAAAVARWRAANVRNYTFVFNISCMCPRTGRMHMTVEESEVVSAVWVDSGFWADSGTAVDTSVYRPGSYTIDSIFGFIQRVLDQHPDTVSAEYDQQLGYPIRFFRSYRPIDTHLYLTIWTFTSGADPMSAMPLPNKRLKLAARVD